MTILLELHNRHIKGTAPKKHILTKTKMFCKVTLPVLKAKNARVFVTTKMLKHLYDSRPAEEYEFILNNLEKIILAPDYVYENKPSKRGQYCFIKTIDNLAYFCSLDKQGKDYFIVTAFRLRKPQYLNNYKLIWSRKGDNLHRIPLARDPQ